MKRVIVIASLALLFWTGRQYPIFTGSTGISMLMCEYSGAGLGVGNSVWVQFENSCATSINY